MAGYATKSINESFGTNIVIKKVDLSWLLAVQLKEIEIRDHHQDTLIFVNNLRTSLLNAKNILENQVDLGPASLEGLTIRIKTYKGETDDNMSIFSETLRKNKPEERTETPFILKSENITIHDVTFRLYDCNKLDTLRFSANDLEVSLKDFYVEGSNVSTKIDKMRFVENHGVFVSDLSTKFAYSRSAMTLEDLCLKTDNKTTIETSLDFKYKREELKEFNDKVQIKAAFKKSSISAKDLNKFYGELGGNDMLYLSGVADGVLNNFSLSNLDLRSKNGMKIMGDFGFVNVLNKDRGFVFDANLKNVTSNYFQLRNVLPNLIGKSLPSEFKRLGYFTMKGLLKVTPVQIDATLSVTSEIGTIISDLQLVNVNTVDNAAYSGEVEFDDFDVGIFTNDPNFGKFSLKADVNGSGFKIENINTTIIGNVESLDFNSYTYNNIAVNGQFQNKKFDGALFAEDKNFKLQFQGLADFSTEIYKFDFNSAIEKIDLRNTNLFTRDSTAILKGNISVNISGNNLDNLIGKASFKKLVYRNQKKAYTFKNFTVNSSLKDSIKIIEVNSEDIVQGKIQGKFLFNELINVGKNALGKVYSNYVPVPVTPHQYLDFDFTVYNQIIDVFLPKISIGNNTRLRGRIDADDHAFKLTFASPKVTAYQNEMAEVLLRLDNNNPLYTTYFTANEINTKFTNLRKVNLINRIKNDTLFFKSTSRRESDVEDSFSLDFFYTINAEKKNVVGLLKSEIKHKDFDWVINPTNNAANKVTFNLKDKDFLLSPFTMVSNEQKIEFKGAMKGEEYKDFQATFDQVKLQSFLPPIDSLHLSGKINGAISLKQQNEKLEPRANVTVENFKINDFEQGFLALNINGKDSYEKYDVSLVLKNSISKSISALGELDFSPERPVMDLNVAIEDYEIAAFSPLGKQVLSKLRGSVSGKFKVKGFIGNPDLNGALEFKDAGLTFPYLNIDMNLKGNTKITLQGQQFLLDRVILEDSKYQTKGNLSGYIAHQDFKLWVMDLGIRTDNLLVLDTEENEDVPYYGTGFLQGTAEITGATSNLDILVEGRTQPGTKFVIPLSDVKTIDNYKLIHFEKRVKEEKEEEKIMEDIKGLDLDIRLEVTKDAVAQVVIDKVSGSELTGSGTGNLAIEINTRGKFNMFGDFKVDKGKYNFKYANLPGISKPFIVQKGGTISWNGSPYDAELDITAIYRTKANPSQILDNINSTRKIPVDLYTKITGGLFSSKQEFDIKIPNANSTVASELEFVLNENDLNSKMQHFTFLLAFGTFYNEDAIGSSATSGITGTASDIASSLITDILNKENNNFQVGVGYVQGDRSDVDNFNSDDQLDVSVSGRISDRVLVNGKVGVPVGAETQNSIIGEFNVEFLLNEEGNLRGTVFNRQNDIQYSIDDEGYTQGIGLSYSVNFNSLSDLKKKIVSRKKLKKNNKDTLLVTKSKNVKFRPVSRKNNQKSNK